MFLPGWLRTAGETEGAGAITGADFLANFSARRLRLGLVGVILAALLPWLGTGCARQRLGRRAYPSYYRRSRKGRVRGIIYTVRKGDTLWRIAKAYGLKLNDLARLNRIRDPHKLEVGRKLFIPGVEKRRAPPLRKKRSRPFRKTKRKVAKAPAREGKEKFLLWPVRGRLSSPFGLRWGSKHEGIDIAAASGTKIRAAASGKVIYSDNKMRYYGNVIIIKHRGGYFTVYAHNSANLVQAGTLVKQGQVIAEVGQSGRASGPHLHFEIRQGERPVNPLLYLPRRQ